MAPKDDDRTRQEFISEAEELLDELGRDLRALESAGANVRPETVNKIFRGVHSLKGLAGMLGFGAISELSHALEDLLDRICVMYGGRVAEELVFGDVSTGAHDDLARATETARQMVTRLGMSERLGAMTFGRSQTYRFLEGMGVEERNYSEQTAQVIDAEVRALLEDQRRRAVEILTEKRPLLERMTQRLLEVETLDRPEIEALLAAPVVSA